MTRLGNSFKRCPKAWLRDDAKIENQLLHDVGFFLEHKVLPLSGGMLEQESRFIETIGIFEAEKSKLQDHAKRQNDGRRK